MVHRTYKIIVAIAVVLGLLCSLLLVLRYFYFLDTHNWVGSFVVTAIIAIFTITLWFTSSEQAKLTKESLDLARQEFISTHRPRIRIKQVQMQVQAHAGDRITARLVIVNAGDTPATISTIRIRFRLLSSSTLLLPEIFDDQTLILQRNDKVTSGTTFVYTDLTDNTILNEAEVLNMRQNKSWFYCFGDVQYRDDLSAFRKTGFYRIWAGGKFITPDKLDIDYEYQD